MSFNKCYYCMEDLPAGSYACPHCGRKPGEKKQPEYALPCGAILRNRYLVGAVLGQGGSCITYIGYDLMLNTKVAVRECFPLPMVGRSQAGSVLWSKRGISKEQSCAGFLMQARKTARLRGVPGIVCVSDILQENNTAYIITDFIEGSTLSARLRRNSLMQWQEAVRLLRPVIRALEEAHRYGITHRNINPANIVITTEGKALLLDLGIAKEADMRTGYDMPHSQPRLRDCFTSPEQHIPGGCIGPWTDVYAVCATMHYCISGLQLPLAMDRITRNLPVEFPDQVPQAFRDVLLRGLDTDYTKRYQSMEELLDALSALTDPRAAQYQAALAGMRAARKADDYRKAEKAFQSLAGFKDSAVLALECRQRITELHQRNHSRMKKLIAVLSAAALLTGAGTAGFVWMTLNRPTGLDPEPVEVSVPAPAVLTMKLVQTAEISDVEDSTAVPAEQHPETVDPDDYNLALSLSSMNESDAVGERKEDIYLSKLVSGHVYEAVRDNGTTERYIYNGSLLAESEILQQINGQDCVLSTVEYIGLDIYRITLNWYNSDGDEVSRGIYAPDGTVVTYTVSEYDAEHRQTRSTSYEAGGAMNGYTDYEYNAEGWYTAASYSADDALTGTRVQEYNSDGLETVTSYAPDGTVASVRSEAADSGWETDTYSNGVLLRQNVYDMHGEIIRFTSYESGQVLQAYQITFDYDTEGRIAVEHFIGTTYAPTYDEAYTYNADGQVSRLTCSGSVSTVSEITYDETGIHCAKLHNRSVSVMMDYTNSGFETAEYYYQNGEATQHGGRDASTGYQWTDFGTGGTDF